MGAAHWRFAPAVRGTPGAERSWVPAAGHDDHGSAEHGADDDPADAGPRYGVGLATRLEVLQWRARRFDPAPWSLPLLVPGQKRPQVLRIPDEPRAALAAVVVGPRGPMTVATVHLSFVPGYNVRQLRQLRAWLAGMPRPLVLLGDLNLPGRIPARVTGWTQLARVATYPSYGPRVQFDHVLAEGLTPEQSARAAATARAVPLGVSDHCALVVDLDL
jgi:endonuclease/exonuclease/phosphatase family metal-dependent hydrolase